MINRKARASQPVDQPDQEVVDQVVAEKPKEEERGNWTKWRTRTISTIAMLVFFSVVVMLGHVALCVMIICIQTIMFKEVVRLGKVLSAERHAPEQSYLQWYWFVVSMVFMNLRSLMRHYKSLPHLLHMPIFSFLIKYHQIICFAAYIGGLVAFVTSLKKGFYKYQFSQFGWCHLTLLIVVYTSHFTISNMFQGLIWFLLPTLLIVANDIFAYIFGFFFGRRFFQRSLIKLSPKKTWEGFIGATLVTFFFAFTLSRFFTMFQLFVCPKTDFGFTLPSCEPDAVFVPVPYQFPAFLVNFFAFFGLPWTSIGIAPIQFHACVFATFASIIAPFGGFFASGFKRAFKIKDFGDSIPGHGGMTDRMDCQMLLGFFVSIYYDTFIRSHQVDVNGLFNMFLRLNSTQQLDMLSRIQNHLGQ